MAIRPYIFSRIISKNYYIVDCKLIWMCSMIMTKNEWKIKKKKRKEGFASLSEYVL